MKKLFGGGRLTEVAVGESFFDSLTITEAHFILGCALFQMRLQMAGRRLQIEKSGRQVPRPALGGMDGELQI